MTVELDRARLEVIVQAVADRLPGDWLLVGGGLVSLWLEPRRVTEDVDLVGIDGSGADRFALLGLAVDLGLPVEALNSAADFFVHRIADWRHHLELFRAGGRGRIYRPSATLFLLLKLRRLSNQDLADCIALLDRAAVEGWPVEANRVVADIDALPDAPDAEVLARRTQLRTAVASYATAV